MKKAKHIVIVLIVSLTVLFGCNEVFRRCFGGWAGSYPFVESWDLYINEPDLIQIIEDVKREHPSLRKPVPDRWELGRDTGDANYWYYIDFYYPDTDEIVHTWVRQGSNSATTTFAFVSLSHLHDSTDFRLINADFWFLENRKQIGKFESRILDPIREKAERLALKKWRDATQ